MNRKINATSVVYSEVLCQLGEGIFHDEKTNRLLWLDITNSLLFVSKLELSGEVASFKLELNPSTIFKVEWPNVHISDSQGVFVFNCSSLNSERVLDLNLGSSCSIDMRTNDGVMFEGKYLFGSMAKIPQKDEGQLFLYDDKKEILISSSIHIGIPNTFIELDDCILISDSFERKVYKYFKNDLLISREEWIDFSKSKMTPDGGCKSNNNEIYIAMWGGSCIKSFDKNACELGEYSLPVPQPTNCVLVGDFLFVTTAREGLSIAELEKYPLSGAIFKIDLRGSL